MKEEEERERIKTEWIQKRDLDNKRLLEEVFFMCNCD